MQIAYWCVLIAAMLPYVWVIVAKAGPAYDNRAPRVQLAHMCNSNVATSSLVY